MVPAREIGKVLAVVALALAAEAGAQMERLHRWKPWEPQRRGLFYMKDQPGQPVQSVHVGAEIATNLMFPIVVDPAGTVLVGGEERFEALMIAGRSVVVVPLRSLAPDESFSLIVKLRDGTSVPFNLRAPRPHDSTDGQVDVFLDQEQPHAIRHALHVARSKVEKLTAENERHAQEELSANHALASLLAQDKSELTPFYLSTREVLHDEGAVVQVIMFKVRDPKIDLRKAAIAFKVTNKDPKRPWELDEVRLMSMTSGDSKAFASRASSSSIGPGGTGTIAVVMDMDVFGTRAESDRLALELWRAGPITRQARVELVAVDDAGLPARIEQRPKSR